MSGIRSRIPKRSAKDKLYARDNDSDSADTDSGIVGKLKRDLKHSGLSRDASEFARRLLDNYHLEEESDLDRTTRVSGSGGKFHSAFQKTVKEMPRCQPQGLGMKEPLEDSRRNSAGEEGDEQESSEAEREDESFCAQANEDESDEQRVQPTTVREGSE